MPSTTTNSVPSRIRNWRPLAKVSAAAAAAALVGGATLSMLSGGVASAATNPAWMMTAGNVQSLSQVDSSTASHFFNTASAYGAGASLIKTPVQAGYATTPVLNYTSYAQFSSDIASGAIKYPYKWVMYDPEDWSATPVGEQQDPVKYLADIWAPQVPVARLPQAVLKAPETRHPILLSAHRCPSASRLCSIRPNEAIRSFSALITRAPEISHFGIRVAPSLRPHLRSALHPAGMRSPAADVLNPE